MVVQFCKLPYLLVKENKQTQYQDMKDSLLIQPFAYKQSCVCMYWNVCIFVCCMYYYVMYLAWYVYMYVHMSVAMYLCTFPTFYHILISVLESESLAWPHAAFHGHDIFLVSRTCMQALSANSKSRHDAKHTAH